MPTERWGELQRNFHEIAKTLNFSNVENCLEWLQTAILSKKEIETLACHLTIGETYFFREPNVFSLIEKELLLPLIASRRYIAPHLRIWSAGCATGEEPYSFAILLKKILPDIQNWSITLLATDINPKFLHKMGKGIYSEWSFRGTKESIKNNYFTKTIDNRYIILPELKQLVTPSYLNLAEDTYPALINNTNGMDIILCRNVLMYFTPEQRQKTINNLYNCLVDNGWLIVGASEVNQEFFSPFQMVRFEGATLYRKIAAAVDVENKLPFITTTPKIAYIAPLQETPRDDSTIEKVSDEQTPYQAAEMYFQNGQFTQVIKILSPLISLGCNAPEILSLFIKSYANQGNLPLALEWCNNALDKNKMDITLYYLKASLLQEIGHYEEAILALKKALYLNPDFALGYFSLGNIARKQKKSAEAKKYFSTALSLLHQLKVDEILPESDGLTAGRLADIIKVTYT